MIGYESGLSLWVKGEYLIQKNAVYTGRMDTTFDCMRIFQKSYLWLNS